MRRIGGEIQKAHPNLTLNEGVYIGGTILKEFVWVTVFALCEQQQGGIKIEPLNECLAMK
jgi:hypothetical protein